MSESLCRREFLRWAGWSAGAAALGFSKFALVLHYS